jgi:hypothetical protein
MPKSDSARAEPPADFESSSTANEARFCLYKGGDTCNLIRLLLDRTDAHPSVIVHLGLVL